jgi:hypothetical protein
MRENRGVDRAMVEQNLDHSISIAYLLSLPDAIAREHGHSVHTSDTTNTIPAPVTAHQR